MTTSMWAHNTGRSGNGTVPVISESIDADETDEWHPASDAEYNAYVAYWNMRDDFNLPPSALVTAMAPGSGWMYLIKDGDTLSGINEEGEHVDLTEADYQRDLELCPRFEL